MDSDILDSYASMLVEANHKISRLEKKNSKLEKENVQLKKDLKEIKKSLDSLFKTAEKTASLFNIGLDKHHLNGTDNE